MPGRRTPIGFEPSQRSALRSPAVLPCLLILAAALACGRPGAPPLPAAPTGDLACQLPPSYLAAREALGFCERAEDCVEIEPEACLPVYYANIATAARSLRGVEAGLATRCDVPAGSCVRELLGPPRCRRGRCETGGRPPKRPRGIPHLSYWPVRYLALELDRPAVLHSYYDDRLPEPQEAHILVEEAGELTLTVEWKGCPEGQIAIPAHYLHRLGQRRDGDRETLRFRVEPGKPIIQVRTPTNARRCAVTITAHLERRDGTAVPARHHGVGYLWAGEG